jgi:alkylation response protein AidB-like acyl-CoA dehydrogenase
LIVDFTFNGEQIELRQNVHRALKRAFAISDLRADNEVMAEQRSIVAARRWAVLVAFDVPVLLVPTSAGGRGRSDVDLVGVLEEAGWAALPDPLLETAALAAPLLAALLPAPAAADALRALVEDNVPLAVGGVDVGPAGPSSPTTISADGILHTPRVVGWRDAATFLLACRDPDSGWQLHAVPAHACTTQGTPTLDPGRDVATVHWPLSADTLLAYGVAAEASVGVMADRAAAGTAALLNGLADRMITLAVDFAQEHHQFGQPIGSFQGIKGLLTHAAIKLEFSRPATYRAAWSLASAQSTVSHDASMAKALASEAAEMAARVALQVYGTASSSWECDLNLFVKRTWALSKAWGDATTHRQLALAQARRRRF